MTAGHIRGQVETRYNRLLHAVSQHARELIPDLQPLDAAIRQIDVAALGERYVWRIALDQLTFLVPVQDGTLPRGCKPPVALRLSVDLSVSIPKEEANSAFAEPTALETQFEIEADHKEGKKRAAWHLDLHDFAPVEGAGAVHPRVHWQHGGRAAKNWGLEAIGGWMLMNPPRLPYPPMDIALTLCWVLANFAPEHWHYMVQVDTDFVALIRHHQAWLWAPYFARIASHWTDNPDVRRLLWWPELLV